MCSNRDLLLWGQSTWPPRCALTAVFRKHRTERGWRSAADRRNRFSCHIRCLGRSHLQQRQQRSAATGSCARGLRRYVLRRVATTQRRGAGKHRRQARGGYSQHQRALHVSHQQILFGGWSQLARLDWIAIACPCTVNSQALPSHSNTQGNCLRLCAALVVVHAARHAHHGYQLTSRWDLQTGSQPSGSLW